MVSNDEILRSARPLSLDRKAYDLLHSGGVIDTRSDRPRMDRHHKARGHELDHSTLHTQQPKRKAEANTFTNPTEVLNTSTD